MTTKKFPAAHAVLELVTIVIEEAREKEIAVANTNDPETLALIERAVERVEKAQAERAIHVPAVVPQWGERALTQNELNSIEALTNYQPGLFLLPVLVACPMGRNCRGTLLQTQNPEQRLSRGLSGRNEQARTAYDEARTSTSR
jgi:hypothetical protein